MIPYGKRYHQLLTAPLDLQADLPLRYLKKNIIS